MATPVHTPGLLSKVAKFVRNPTTDWADLDKIATLSVGKSDDPPESTPAYNRQALKDVVERKRHDDEIRKREFDYLRQLRRHDATITPDMVAQAFRNTTDYSELEDRSGTLKKIDEIEAQMSKQWWKGNQHNTFEASVATSDGTLSESEDWNSRATAQVAIDSFASTLVARQYADSDDTPTLMGSSESADTAPGAPYSQASSRVDRSPPSDFALDMAVPSPQTVSQDALSDPELEEAAIRFANADNAGAEQVLQAALRAGGDASVRAVWFAALFDLYRSTDQRDKFETLALDYARRSGQSAPLWFSVPERWAKVSGVRQPTVGSSEADNVTRWQCPALLDVRALASLHKVATSGSSVLVLDWSCLTRIDPSVVPHLANLFAKWCDQTRALHFEAVHVLEQLLRLATPVSARDVEVCWWHLRLDMLRILRLQDDYELAALDYCVTFEVSPPPWRDARCQYMEKIPLASAQPVHPPPQEASVGSKKPAVPSHASLLEPAPVRVLEAVLGGELLGDMAQTLLPSEQHFKTATSVVISCSNLIRVDFSAAGGILNWAATGQALGCRIEFVDVARLVAAFFYLIGISEHARVVVRTNE